MWVIKCEDVIVIPDLDTEVEAINLCREMNLSPGVKLGTFKVEWVEDNHGIHPLPN